MAPNPYRAETNQQIFESCVRSLLDHCGVPQIDQPIEGLLESIQHGEGSVDTALNLVVVAHIAHLFLKVHVPIEEPEWTDALRCMSPRIKNGLQSCHDLLVRNLPKQTGESTVICEEWTLYSLIPHEYGMQPWGELTGSRFLKCAEYGTCFVSDLYLLWLKQQKPTGRIKLNSLIERVGERVDLIEKFGEHATAWHRFVVADAIHDFLEEPNRLEWEEWCVLVDLCSELMQSAESATESLLEDVWTPTSQIPLSPKSTEYWAWEFGRVAAMWPLVDKTTFDSHESEYFYDWPNGLAALSLQLGASTSDDDLFDRCWTGAAVASGLKSESGWHSAYPGDQSPSDHLFWLMRLGFLHGSRRVESSELVLPARPVEPSESHALLLGSYGELGRAIEEAKAAAEQEREGRIHDELAERLGRVWDILPPDSQDHLFDAELNLKERNRRDASLDYATAVEIALSEWLSAPRDLSPRDQSDWPEGIGKWVGCLQRMAGARNTRGGLDSFLRRRFDPGYASKLANALDVLREARLPRAHGERHPPFANKARHVVLGEDQRLGVFELILRFAKRWQG